MIALLKWGDGLKFSCFSPLHSTRAPRPGILGEATNFAKGALIGGIIVLLVWLVLG